MDVRKIQQWCLSLSKNFRLIHNLVLLSLPLALFSVSANKALAAEDNGMSQINSVRQLKSKEKSNSLQKDNGMSQVTNVQQLSEMLHRQTGLMKHYVA